MFRSFGLLGDLRDSERLMTAFGEHCRARLLASLHRPTFVATASVFAGTSASMRHGAHRRSWRPSLSVNGASASASASAGAFSASAPTPDAHCLSALILSKRSSTVGAVPSVATRAITADDLLPATVRAACDALVAFAPTAKYGASATGAQVQKGYAQPVRARVDFHSLTLDCYLRVDFRCLG